MQRILLVLDMDLLAVDDHFDLAPINHLMARQEQEPCEVTVLSLVDIRQTHLSGMELALGARAGKFPVAPRPDHDISADAEHRLNLATRHLKAIGCQATGLVSDQPLLKAVRAETRSHDYDEVVLATGSQESTLLARIIGQDPVHRLRRRWGRRLIVFSQPASHATSLGSSLPAGWRGAVAWPDDAVLVGVDGDLHPVPQAELGENADDVAFDGCLAEVEPGRDLGVRQPCCDGPSGWSTAVPPDPGAAFSAERARQRASRIGHLPTVPRQPAVDLPVGGPSRACRKRPHEVRRLPCLT